MNATISKLLDAMNAHDAEGLVSTNRLYTEPVEHDGPGILESERQLREPAR